MFNWHTAASIDNVQTGLGYNFQIKILLLKKVGQGEKLVKVKRTMLLWEFRQKEPLELVALVVMLLKFLSQTLTGLQD